MENQLIEKNDWLAPVWVSAYLQYVPGWLVVHVEYTLIDMEGGIPTDLPLTAMPLVAHNR
jgi:hypothetical protein